MMKRRWRKKIIPLGKEPCEILEKLKELRIPSCCACYGEDMEEIEGEEKVCLLPLPPCSCITKLITGPLPHPLEKMVKDYVNDGEKNSKCVQIINKKETTTESQLISDLHLSELQVQYYDRVPMCRSCIKKMLQISSEVIELEYRDPNQPNPKFTVEAKCPHCSAKFSHRGLLRLIKNERSWVWENDITKTKKVVEVITKVTEIINQANQPCENGHDGNSHNRYNSQHGVNESHLDVRSVKKIFDKAISSPSTSEKNISNISSKKSVYIDHLSNKDTVDKPKHPKKDKRLPIHRKNQHKMRQKNTNKITKKQNDKAYLHLFGAYQGKSYDSGDLPLSKPVQKGKQPGEIPYSNKFPRLYNTSNLTGLQISGMNNTVKQSHSNVVQGIDEEQKKKDLVRIPTNSIDLLSYCSGYNEIKNISTNRQYKRLSTTQLPAQVQPKRIKKKDDSYRSNHIDFWCTGFFSFNKGHAFPHFAPSRPRVDFYIGKNCNPPLTKFVNDRDVSRLVTMGFDRTNSIRCLSICEGNLTRTVSMLSLG